MWYLRDLEQESADLGEWCSTARGLAVELPFVGDFLDWLLERFALFFTAAAERIHHLNDWADVITSDVWELLHGDTIKLKVEEVYGLTIVLFAHGSAIEDHEDRIYSLETAVPWEFVAPETPEEKPPWYAKILGFPLDLTDWLFTSIVERLEGFFIDRVDWVFEVGRRVLIKLI